MPDEVTFIDLACLLRITPDTTLEKLGSAINASIFDASNIAGTLKQKGLIDFSAYYPGPNTISVTAAGKALIAEGDAKVQEPFDNLDETILFQLSGGKRVPIELQNTLNLRPKDLALRLYKLQKQGYLTSELKSGSVDIMLTEAGFLKAKSQGGVMPKPAAAQQQSPMQPQPAQKPMPGMGQPQPMPTPQMPPQGAGEPQQPHPETPVVRHGKPTSIWVYLIMLIIVILALVGVLYYKGIISFG